MNSGFLRTGEQSDSAVRGSPVRGIRNVDINPRFAVLIFRIPSAVCSLCQSCEPDFSVNGFGSLS